MWRRYLLTLLFAFLSLARAAADGPANQVGKGKIIWKKTVVDKVFRSEGVAVADVNKDGKMDILAGDVWYEAPDWKMHVIRQAPAGLKGYTGPKYNLKGYDPRGYSYSFAVFAEDINGDGWVDTIVISFPGTPCHWYENPGMKGGLWKQHVITHSACNETPLYADLFGTGKRVLVMGVQPKGEEHMGQMFWLRPGKDPTQVWEHHPISEPSQKGKEIYGTFKYHHGLGVGDVNGDKRNDVLCTAGWWEQPADAKQSFVEGIPKRSLGTREMTWKFHPADLKPDCADMYAFDMDGDGRNDIVSSAAHQIGMWWHQQKGSAEAPVFVRHELFPGMVIAADAKNYPLLADEKSLLDAINKYRATKDLRPVRPVPELCLNARTTAIKELAEKVPERDGRVASIIITYSTSGAALAEQWLKDAVKSAANDKLLLGDWQEVGVGLSKDAGGKASAVVFFKKGNTPPGKGIVVWEGMKKQLVSQTHALNFVDVNGDGVKDLVTGRRWWAHGPRGDALPTEPAYLFWFEGRRTSDGIMNFIPHLIDDDSGVGTQFTVIDINGDGIPDIIVSNKKGVFVFEQIRKD